MKATLLVIPLKVCSFMIFTIKKSLGEQGSFHFILD